MNIGNFSFVKDRNSWHLCKKLQRLCNLFGKKWKSDYLNVLQARFKWMAEKNDLMIGQMVLIKDDFSPVNT